MPMIVLIFLIPTTHIHKEKERFYYDCQTSQAGSTARTKSPSLGHIFTK